MCDHVHYDQLEGRVGQLEGSVDQLKNRLTAVETTLDDMREESKAGFADLKDELKAIYAERAAWGKWARENIGHALRWAGVIILTACGITQASSIIQELAKAFGRG